VAHGRRVPRLDWLLAVARSAADPGGRGPQSSVWRAWVNACAGQAGAVRARGSCVGDDHQAVAVPVSLLVAGDSPRLNGEDAAHIRVLAEAGVELPPILVHRSGMRVIDGMHRLSAARARGQVTIEARFFDGSQDEAFVLGVKANMAHGLPLTLADRQAAAARIMACRPYRSDRWIAAVTGLSAGTVAAIRRRAGQGGAQVTTRIGKDGRARPVSSAAGRRIASDAITKNPGASLREIAKVAGISPATVLDVRERMRRGDGPVPPRQPSGRQKQAPAARAPAPGPRPAGISPGEARSRGTLLQALARDPSLRFTEPGRLLLRWVDEQATGPEGWQDVIDAAPPHCMHIVAELARRCAADWLDLAQQLERRLRAMS
jgi:hypothetical protein